MVPSIATPEVAKINTIADIIASCINTTSSSSGACLALFGAAVATPTSLAATTNFATSYNPLPATGDTLQAALFMLQNPTDAGTVYTSCNGTTVTSNIACLFSLASGYPQYPGLSTAPTDWTIGVTYASTSTQTVSGTTVGYLNEPEYLAIDKSGNVWINNYVVPTATGYGNGLTELNPQGGIMQQALTGMNQLQGPRIPVIDPSGNIWSPNLGATSASSAVGYAKTVTEYTPSNSTAKLYTVAGGPFELASDGAGNIFVAETSTAVTNTGGGSGTPGADVEEITAGSATTTAPTVISPTTGYTATVYGSIEVDSQFRPWIASGATNVYALVPPATGTTYTLLTTSSGVVDAAGLALDSGNNAFVSNYASTGAQLDKFDIASGAIATAAGPFTPAGLGKAQYTAIDGARQHLDNGIRPARQVR